MTNDERFVAAVTEARKLAESVADYHTWDFARGTWVTAQAILKVAGQAAVVCRSDDCKDHENGCEGLPGGRREA